MHCRVLFLDIGRYKFSKSRQNRSKTAILAQFWPIFGNVRPYKPINIFVFDFCGLYASGRKQTGHINCNSWTYAGILLEEESLCAHLKFLLEEESHCAHLKFFITFFSYFDFCYF